MDRGIKVYHNLNLVGNAKNHKNISSRIYKESKDDMTNSYIMLDPYGRFYQNENNSYTYSKSIDSNYFTLTKNN